MRKRQSQQRYRDKKRNQVSRLEAEISSLRDQNENLKRLVAQLENEVINRHTFSDELNQLTKEYKAFGLEMVEEITMKKADHRSPKYHYCE